MPSGAKINSSKAASKGAAVRKARTDASKEQRGKNADSAVRVKQNRHEKKETQEKKAAEKAEKHVKKLADRKKKVDGQRALEMLASWKQNGLNLGDVV